MKRRLIRDKETKAMPIDLSNNQNGPSSENDDLHEQGPSVADDIGDDAGQQSPMLQMNLAGEPEANPAAAGDGWDSEQWILAEGSEQHMTE